jgi:glycosyltransferase involved in cell wall biosynthesis
MGGDTRHFATLAEDLGAHPRFSVEVMNTSRGQEHSNPLRNLAMAWKTLWTVVTNLKRVDVISYHASDRGMLLFAPFIVVLCRLAGVPTILRVFGGSFGDFYESSGFVARAITRRFILSADVILLQTQRAIRQLRFEGRGRLEWFSTYIKVAQRSSQEELERPQCRRFIFLGHLWRTKGLETLLDSAAHLPDDATLDIYGPLDEYTEAEIRERGRGRVFYRGFLSHRDVDATLWKYDCLVLPTWHPGEGYPGVIAEAFAHGLPVISTRWLAIPEIVDETCGILIEPRDSAAFVKAVARLHRDPEYWRALKRGALARGAQFDHTVWSRKFETICEGLVRS